MGVGSALSRVRLLHPGHLANSTTEDVVRIGLRVLEHGEPCVHGAIVQLASSRAQPGRVAWNEPAVARLAACRANLLLVSTRGS